MKNQITNYIRAGYAGLYIVSPEDQRVESEIKAIADSVKFDLFFWNAVDGMVNASNGAQNSALDPLEALQAVEDQKEKTITLLKDFHLHLTDPNPILISKLKQVLAVAKTQNKTIIVLGCRLCLPPELEREITVIDFSLPDEEQLGIVRGVGRVWISAAQARQFAGFRHGPFSEEVRDILRNIKSILDEVYPKSIEEWENGFRKDSQPEQEIAIWLNIASIYQQFTADKPLSFAERRDIFRVLVNCSISSKDTVFEVVQLEAISREEAERVVEAYFS